MAACWLVSGNPYPACLCLVQALVIFPCEYWLHLNRLSAPGLAKALITCLTLFLTAYTGLYTIRNTGLIAIWAFYGKKKCITWIMCWRPLSNRKTRALWTHRGRVAIHRSIFAHCPPSPILAPLTGPAFLPWVMAEAGELSSGHVLNSQYGSLSFMI